MTGSSASQPDPVLVWDALRRIMESSVLQEGSLPARMLTHVVERMLAGDGKSIKAYTIAVEAFGRGADFDPDRDSSVRVTASRLRTCLDLYYAGPGAADPLRIRMVPGSYRPSFETASNGEAGCPQAPPRKARARLLSRLEAVPTFTWLAVLSVVLLVDIAMTVSLMALQLRGEAASPEGRSAVEAPARTEAPASATVYDYIRRNIHRSFYGDAK